VEVIFPDGTRVLASSLAERDEHVSGRDFGLYLDTQWKPTWPAEMIDWPDFELPRDRLRAAAQIRAAFARAKGGQGVEIGCIGGLGRTGTVLACMAVLAGVASSEAVAWVREHYRSSAIETPDQESWVEWFAESERESRPRGA
jgi:protein-tyrosine phosphatase